MISKMIDGQEVPMSGTSEALIAQKADKVASATNGNLASLDATGNLADSGVKGDVSTTTLNGNPLSFTTDSEQAARECVITLQPLQAGSGDPSPSNVRAISGYDSVIIDINLWDTTFSEWGKYLTSDGTEVELNGFCISNYIEVKPNCNYKYYIPSGITSNVPAICWYDENKTYIGGEATSNRNEIMVTTPSNAKYIRFSVYQANINYRLYKLPLIFSYNESLPETVYGGTLNVETGELVVTHKKITLNGSEGVWTHSSSWSASPNALVKDNLMDDAVPVTGYQTEANIISNQAIISTPNKIAADNTSGRIAQGNGKELYLDLGVDVYSIEAYLASNPLEVYYELATPYTIHLTPSQVRLLQGNNVVTTNGTSIKLTYRNGEVATLSDVSSVAESVNALGEKVRLRATSSSSGTESAKLLELSDTYNSLSIDEKLKAFIVRNGTIYRAINNLGVFICTSIPSAGIAIVELDIFNGKNLAEVMASNGTWTFTDNSSISGTSVYYLYA